MIYTESVNYHGLVIILEIISGGWKAYRKHDKKATGIGRSKEEAIGNLMIVISVVSKH